MAKLFFCQVLPEFWGEWAETRLVPLISQWGTCTSCPPVPTPLSKSNGAWPIRLTSFDGKYEYASLPVYHSRYMCLSDRCLSDNPDTLLLLIIFIVVLIRMRIRSDMITFVVEIQRYTHTCGRRNTVVSISLTWELLVKYAHLSVFIAVVACDINYNQLYAFVVFIDVAVHTGVQTPATWCSKSVTA